MGVRFLVVGTILLGCVAIVCAEPESKPAASDDSPKGALKAQDAAARAGKVDEDESFIQAGGEQEQKLAHLLAAADVAVARLEKTVEQKFGKELALAAVHALDFKDDSDIDAASEKIDGDKATVTFKDDPSALHMVRVDGKWKIALAEELKQSDAAQLQQTVEKMTDEIRRITALVEGGKFRSGEGVRDRLQELHDKLFGGAPEK